MKEEGEEGGAITCSDDWFELKCVSTLGPSVGSGTRTE